MSHAVNTEILESLHEEVVSEWIADNWRFAKCIGRPLTEDDLHTAGVEAEVMKRFEEIGL